MKKWAVFGAWPSYGHHSPKFGEYCKAVKALHAALTVTVSTNSIKLSLD